MPKTLAKSELSPVGDTAIRRRAWDSLMRVLSERSQSGDDKLPSERRLSELVGVSRPTIRTLLEEMQRRRIIKRVAPRTRKLSSGSIMALTGSSDQMLGVVCLVSMQSCQWSNIQSGRHALGWPTNLMMHVMQAASHRTCPLLTLDWSEINEQTAQMIQQRGVTNVVLDCSGIDDERAILFARQIKSMGIGVVAYGDWRKIAGVPTVLSDHHAGGRAAAQYLIDRGARRLAFYNEDKNWENRSLGWLTDRVAGYSEACRQSGLDELMHIRGVDLPENMDAARRFEVKTGQIYAMIAPALAKGVDGFVLSSDGLSAPLVAALRLCNKTPNLDVHVAGYDNYWFECHEREFEAVGPCATVDKQQNLICELLWSLLDEQLHGKLNIETARTVEPKLVELSINGLQRQ